MKQPISLMKGNTFLKKILSYLPLKQLSAA